MIEIKLADAAWSGVEDGVEALLEKWMVAAGEPVAQGQVLACVMLVKAAIDIEAPVDGVVTKVLVHAGESFSVGTAIALFEPTPG